MSSIPIFKPHLHVEVIPGEGALILSEEIARALHGDAYAEVVALIDGKRSADSIVDALAGRVDPAAVYYVLQVMRTKGYLGSASTDRDADAFWYSAGLDPVAAAEARTRTAVALHAVGGLDAEPMRAALDEAGVRTTTPDLADFFVVLADDYQNPELDAINREALRLGRPWLLVRPRGRELWIGPHFRPNHGACWSCLDLRISRNRAIHRFAAERCDLPRPPATALGALPATTAAACRMAAVTVMEILAGKTDLLHDEILSIDWATHGARNHRLVPHPHCVACGAPAPTVAEPVVLRPGRAAFTRDAGHRSVAPEATLKRFEHLVSPISGIVRMLVPASFDDAIAHVYVAGHNHAFRIERLAHLRQGLRNTSGGKGMSETQAKVSALCEAIERYSGEWTGAEHRVLAAFADFAPGEAVHPHEVMLYSDRQYAERERWNERGSRFNVVPVPLADDVEIDWTPVWSLTEERHKMLPTQLVYYAAPASENDETFYAFGCSNGNASGNTLEEAILQGFFELVERDAVAIWWYNRLRRPTVDLADFGEPYLVDLVEHYRSRHGRDIWALDLTNDLGIPVFVAIARLRDGPEERLQFGFGCHLDPRIALLRAFAEMNQMLGIAHTSADGALRLEDPEALRWLRGATIENQPHLAPAPGLPPRRRSDFTLSASGDFLEDIALCRAIVEARGMEMLVLDQTRADVGLPTAKVVVPGLRHFWARYAPGRLYDVPVAMGWLDRPTAEEDLNPIPIFL